MTPPGVGALAVPHHDAQALLSWYSSNDLGLLNIFFENSYRYMGDPMSLITGFGSCGRQLESFLL